MTALILLRLWAVWAGCARAQDYLLPSAPPASTTTVHLDFTADHLDYDAARAKIHLKGAVRVTESTWTIKADELWLDTARRLGESEGFLLVEDGSSAVYGDSGEFDFGRHTGILRRTSAGHGDWRIHARSVRLDADRTLHYVGADFTSCSYDPNPDYHFHSTSLSVVPRRHLLAYNTLFYLGPVPLLYTPFLYKSLDPSSWLSMKVQPGYDRRNGAFLKDTVLKSFGGRAYGKLFLDYYSAQGFGGGGELQRHQGQDSRGALYGYNIHETSAGRDRWAVLGDGYQALASSVAAQARMQVQSDPDFNNDYARAGNWPVTPQLVNNGALLYRTAALTGRLSYSRLDDASPDGRTFFKAAESTPRLDVATTQLKLWKLPWLNTFSGFADNAYRSGSFTQRSVGGTWEATRTFNIAPEASFTPKLDYSQSYYSRVDELALAPEAPGLSTSTTLDAFVGRYSAQETIRLKSLAGDWDFSYLYSRRQKAGGFADDAQAADYGVEASQVSVEDFFRPARKVLVRVFSGYDFRIFRDRSVGFRERVEPFVGEVDYTPRPALNFSLRDDYQLARGNRSFLFNGSWGEESATHLGGGVGYNSGYTGAYQFDGEFGYAPSTQSWRVSGVLRWTVSTPGGLARLNGLGLFDKELAVTKLWHDFFTSAQMRFRTGGVREVSVRAELKLGAVSADAARRRDWESEWFPERKSGVEERP